MRERHDLLLETVVAQSHSRGKGGDIGPKRGWELGQLHIVFAVFIPTKSRIGREWRFQHLIEIRIVQEKSLCMSGNDCRSVCTTTPSMVSAFAASRCPRE